MSPWWTTTAISRKRYVEELDGEAKDVKDEKFTGQPSKHNCDTKLKACVLVREISVRLHSMKGMDTQTAEQKA